MLDFERTRQSMQGHGVTVTSWFDAGKQVWRASAPAYIHVTHEWPATALQGPTRLKAVENLTLLLCHYFDGLPANV